MALTISSPRVRTAGLYQERRLGMTSKDFSILAKAFRARRDCACDEIEAIQRATDICMDVLKVLNPRFNRGKFMNTIRGNKAFSRYDGVERY
jgi:hypothetical protein